MNKKIEDIPWIWQVNFLKKAVLGAIVCTISVYFATLPFFIKPLYESEVIVYVPLTIQSQQLNQQGIGFANQQEIDWYIQILKSNNLADSLIKRFNLTNVFEIDTSNLGTKSWLLNKLESHIRIEKTRYGSVSIKVWDTDPKRAAALANDIVEFGEIIKTRLLYPNRLEAKVHTQNLFEQKVSEVTILEQKLDSVEKFWPSKRTKKDLQYDKILKVYNLELQELILRKDAYEREKNEFDTPLPKAYILSPAIPVPNTVWPKRGLFSAFGAGIYLILLIVIEIIKRDIQEKKLQ